MGNAAPLGAWHVAHSAHIVGAVCQFDQDDANVAGHRQKHFSERLGLVFFPGGEVQFVEFGQSVYHFSHGGTKTLNNFRFADAAVFYRIV